MVDSSSQHDREPLNEVRRAPTDDDVTTAAPALQDPLFHAPDGSVAEALLPFTFDYISLQQETVITKPAPAVDKSSTPPAPIPLGSTPQQLGRLLQGTSLGHFRLEEFVGGGGMGAVFRAADTMLGRTVAVKVLAPDKTDSETLRRFQNEAQSAARLDHANIARVYYHGEDKGLHYIVFEFIEGQNIRQVVEQRGSLPLDEAINFTLQVAEALEHASQQGVVHRDIKPSNILVLADGRAKLVDMGLARLHQSGAEDLTASGVTLGTFDYISPEQARDPRAADVRSDLYSLGCTLYFMLTGRPPFPNGTVLQKLLSHSSEEPSDPRMYRPELEEDVIRIIHKLLAKQPGQRYQRPSELVGELLLLAERLGFTSVTGGGTVWISGDRSPWSRLESHLPWLVPLAVLLIAVLATARLWPTASSTFANTQRPVLAPPMDSRPLDAPRLPSEDIGKQLPDAESAAELLSAGQSDGAGSLDTARPDAPVRPNAEMPLANDPTAPGSAPAKGTDDAPGGSSTPESPAPTDANPATSPASGTKATPSGLPGMPSAG